MRKQAVALYARVSSSQQKEDQTIDSQVDMLIKYANENALEVNDEWIFKDEGYSGASLDRPGLDELRNLTREGIINVILIYSPDRLSRRYVSQLILEEEFKKHSVKIVYLNGAKNTTPEEQLLKHFQGIFAEYERTQILDRSRRGKLYKARNGVKDVLARAPYGYENNRDNFYSINQHKASIVRDIFRLYTKENYSLLAISTYLTNNGISTPTGRLKWCPTTVRGIINNTAYIGTAYYGKTERGEGDHTRIARYKQAGKVVKAKSAKKDRPMNLWNPISVPAIICEADFEAAQELLKRNKVFAKRNTKRPSILQGLLVCGQCGCSYCKRSYGKGGKWSSYYCQSQLCKREGRCKNKGVNQEELDTIVWTNIMQLLKNPELLEEEIKRRIDDDPKKKQIEGREQEIKKEQYQIKNAHDKLLDAYQEGECITLGVLKERLQALQQKERILKKELESLQALSLLSEKRKGLQLTIDYVLQDLRKNAENLTVEKKQQVLRALIDEIVIMPGEITIKHVIPFNPCNSFHLRSVCGF